MGQDPSVQATAILLIKKSYFSKPHLEQWKDKFKNTPEKWPKKQEIASSVASPWQTPTQLPEDAQELEHIDANILLLKMKFRY